MPGSGLIGGQYLGNYALLNFPNSIGKIIPPTPIYLIKQKYTFLVLSRNGAFIHATESWSFDTITSEINGSMMVKIKTDQLVENIAKAITELGNNIIIRIATPNTGSQGIVYFSGFIPNRGIKLDGNAMEITAFGYASRLFSIPYRSGTTVAIDKTSGIKASDLAKDVIDKAQALDSHLPITYLASSIEDSGTTVKDKFIMQQCGDVINRATLLAFDENSIWHWVVGGDNIFHFKKSAAAAQHQFVWGRDAIDFPTFEQDLQQAYNDVLVVYNNGANIKRSYDADSIAQHGIIAMPPANEANIPDATTATTMANAYLEMYKPPIIRITITISNQYPKGIENIRPGDTCRVGNLPIDIAKLLNKNMFIVRTVYHGATIDLDLALKTPFLQNKIDLIRKRLEKESVESITATTYS